jgi:hypothetical protein
LALARANMGLDFISGQFRCVFFLLFLHRLYFTCLHNIILLYIMLFVQFYQKISDRENNYRFILSSNKGIFVWPIWPEVNCQFSHPGKITVIGLLQDHFHIEAHIGIGQGQYKSQLGFTKTSFHLTWHIHVYRIYQNCKETKTRLICYILIVKFDTRRKGSLVSGFNI